MKPDTRYFPQAQSLYHEIMDKLEDKPPLEQYHVLRYLTNFLESAEADIYRSSIEKIGEK